MVGLWVIHARMLARENEGSGSLNVVTGLKRLKAARTRRQASFSVFGRRKFFLTVLDVLTSVRCAIALKGAKVMLFFEAASLALSRRCDFLSGFNKLADAHYRRECQKRTNHRG